MLTGLSEDCLYADVYVPAAPPPPGGYPVMLFFYGGSWTYGGASFPLYDGETDVALMKDVILVASNYRLNVFGYLAGDELLAESADKSVGNYVSGPRRARARGKQGVARNAVVRCLSGAPRALLERRAARCVHHTAHGRWSAPRISHCLPQKIVTRGASRLHLSFPRAPRACRDSRTSAPS